MKSITFIFAIFQITVILMAMVFLPEAHSLGVDPGVVSREISRSAPAYNSPNNSQPLVIIYHEPTAKNGTVTIDTRKKNKRHSSIRQ